MTDEYMSALDWLSDYPDKDVTEATKQHSKSVIWMQNYRPLSRLVGFQIPLSVRHARWSTGLRESAFVC